MNIRSCVLRDGHGQPVAYQRLWLLGILVVAFGIRLILFLSAAQNPSQLLTPDSPAYMDLARDLSAYNDPGSEHFEISLNRTPGYPVFVRGGFLLLPDEEQSVVLLQLALAVVSVLLCYKIAQHFFNESTALLAALLFAVDPISCVFTNYVMTETLFTFLILLTTLILLKSVRSAGTEGRGSRRAESSGSAGASPSQFPRSAEYRGSLLWLPCIAGLGFGLAALVRPAGLYLPVLIFVVFVFGAGRWPIKLARSGVFVAGVLVVVGGWIGHNYHYTGVPVFSIIEGKDALYWRAAGAVAETSRMSRPEAATDLAERLWQQHGVSIPEEDRAQIRRHMKHSHWTALNDYFDRAKGELREGNRPSYQLASEEKRLAVQTLLEHPRGAALNMGKSVFNLLLGPGVHRTLHLVGIDPDAGRSTVFARAFAAFSAVFLAVCYLGAVFGFVGSLKNRKYLATYIMMAVLLYFTLVSLGPTACSRYRVPMMPFLCMFAAYGITTMKERWQNHRVVG